MALPLDVISQTLHHQFATPVLPWFNPTAPPTCPSYCLSWPMGIASAKVCCTQFLFPAHQEAIVRFIAWLKCSQCNTSCLWCVAAAAFWAQVIIRRQWPRMPQMMLLLLFVVFTTQEHPSWLFCPKKETSSFSGILSEGTCSESFSAQVLERIIFLPFFHFWKPFLGGISVSKNFSSGRGRLSSNTN